MKKFVDNILSSGFEFDNANTLNKLRFNIINSLLIFLTLYTFLVGIAFTYLATQESVSKHGISNFLFSLVAFSIIFYLRKSRDNYIKVVHIISVISIILLTSAYINVVEDKLRIMYFGLAALAISLIGGKRYGQIYSVLVICLVLSMHHFINLGYTNLEIFTFTVAFIGISLLSTSFIGAFDKEAIELKKLNIKLYDLSIKDQLTGVFNRKGFDKTIEDKVELFKNTSEQFGLIIADIDNFKSINDNYGHSVGDDILIEFTKLLELNIGENDTLCRWGGEEFAIISAQNNLNTTVELAEKIRLAVSQADMPKVKHITASFGVATVDKNDDKFSIVKKADEALYKAKTSGKNKVVK